MLPAPTKPTRRLFIEFLIYWMGRNQHVHRGTSADVDKAFSVFMRYTAVTTANPTSPSNAPVRGDVPLLTAFKNAATSLANLSPDSIRSTSTSPASDSKTTSPSSR